MGDPQSPKDDKCERFLARQEPWVRAILKGEYESPDIPPALAAPGGFEALNEARDEYHEVLKSCPNHLREYRKLQAKLGATTAGTAAASLLSLGVWVSPMGCAEFETQRPGFCRISELLDKETPSKNHRSRTGFSN
jgi:hypothetical protein